MFAEYIALSEAVTEINFLNSVKDDAFIKSVNKLIYMKTTQEH